MKKLYAYQTSMGEVIFRTSDNTVPDVNLVRVPNCDVFPKPFIIPLLIMNLVTIGLILVTFVRTLK